MDVFFEHKSDYEHLMRTVLAGSICAEEAVQTFFHMRRTHLDLEQPMCSSLSLQPDEIRWMELFAELFHACDDLDTTPESIEKATPYIIDEATFRQQIGDILPRFEAFKLSLVQ